MKLYIGVVYKAWRHLRKNVKYSELNERKLIKNYKI